MATTIRKAGPPAREDSLRALEAELSTTLPDEYRRFLAQYNGGSPRPREFDIRWADPHLGSAHRSTEVGYFFSADGQKARVLDYHRMYGDELPPGYLAVATDPGGDQILLGLEGAARGRVYYWIHDMDPEYDRADPANLGFVAESWDAFLAGLYGDPDD